MPSQTHVNEIEGRSADSACKENGTLGLIYIIVSLILRKSLRVNNWYDWCITLCTVRKWFATTFVCTSINGWEGDVKHCILLLQKMKMVNAINGGNILYCDLAGKQIIIEGGEFYKTQVLFRGPKPTYGSGALLKLNVYTSRGFGKSWAYGRKVLDHLCSVE